MKYKQKWAFLPLSQKLKQALLCLSILVSSIFAQGNVYAETDCITVTEIPRTECQVLLEFYDSTNGDSWTNKTGWNTTNTPCSWTGITCSNGYVTRLELGSNQLSGSMPSNLGNLTKLQRLNLYNNQLVGTIPTELGSLSSLQFLILGNNQLTGAIPSELGNLSNLKDITLSSNQLAGTIPSALSNLTRLTGIRLDYNQLNGAVPSVSTLTNLLVFELLGNSLCKDETVNYGFWNSRVSIYPICTLNSDADSDGIIDGVDNCPAVYNSGQLDTDNDTIGDSCEPDTDGDHVVDDNDAFFLDPTESEDSDGDGLGNNSDNCPYTANSDQSDSDSDGTGDVCDGFTDSDGDGIADDADNCPDTINPQQVDTDRDGIGDDCDILTDSDDDSVADDVDNCPYIANSDQLDSNNNGIGNSCDSISDSDNDGIKDNVDNCPTIANSGQVDVDQDGMGDDCDSLIDSDNDGIADDVDNCPTTSNADQADSDGDNIGDACDTVDTDGDGIADDVDNCPFTSNSSQADSDNNGIGDACDAVDTDGDGIADESDNCPSTSNSDQADSDNNGIGDACDMQGELSPIYRFWSSTNKAHFFTINETEKDYIIATYPEVNWKYGGEAYYAYKSTNYPEGTSPVYRFYSASNKAHFFTINETEKDYIIATYPEVNWKYGGIAWYAYKVTNGSCSGNTSPVYRFWSQLNKKHFFTASEGEKDMIIATYPEENWKYGGIAWCAYK